MNRRSRAWKVLRRRFPRAGYTDAPVMTGEVTIEGVRVVAADAELLAVLLYRAGDRDVARRLRKAVRENFELPDISMDDRLAIVRALEECPGEMVELRARLLSGPQPTWRQQRSG